MPDHARRTLRPGPRLGPVTLLTLVLGVFVSSARAADDSARASAVANAIEQIALLDLRMQQVPLPRDYQLTHHTLSLAAALDTDDLELQHKILAAAWGTTDERLLLRTTRRIVELDPDDTVAQLRLISAIIAKLQTGEERLAAYERYLGPRGESIDPSVRSRLAFDAANLARELGDEQRFVELLSMSTRLDITNKLAATMAMSYHAERREDPVERLEMLVNLLYADPLDSNIHMAIAQLLASEGAFEQARRYFQLGALIHQHAGDANLSLLQQGLLFQWHHEGPESVVKSLNDMIARRRQAIAENRAMAAAVGELTPDMPLPEDDRLDPGLDRVRALAAGAAGDEQSREMALGDMSKQTTEQVRQLTSYLAGNDEDLKQEAMIQMAQLFGELHFTSILSGASPEASARAVQVFAAQTPDLNRLIRWLIPWITLRLGEHDNAESVKAYLESGVGLELFEAELALARGEKQKAARGFLAVMQATPISPLGAWSHTRLASIVGTDDLRTAAGKKMDAFARSIPTVIDAMLLGPGEFMNLRFEPVASTLAPTQQAMVRIRLQNTTTIPLGMGAGRPISSRMIIQPHVDTEFGVFEGMPQPEVVDLDRRLRLAPREAVEVIVPADSPFTQRLLELNADTTMRLSWRLLQGFRASREQGALASGPLCHSAETISTVIRLPVSSAPMSLEELARRFRAAPEDELERTLLAARALLLRPNSGASTPQPWDEQDLADVVAAAIERYERADQLDRAMMLAMLPHATMLPGMSAFDARVRELLSVEIRSGDPVDPITGALVLFTRTSDANDPLFEEVAESGAPAVRDMGVLMRRRFATNGSGYAQATGDINTLAGPTLAIVRANAEATAAAAAAAARAAEEATPASPEDGSDG